MTFRKLRPVAAVGVSDAAYLRFLAASPGVSAPEVGRGLGVAKSTALYRLTRLQKLGQVVSRRVAGVGPRGVVEVWSVARGVEVPTDG